MPIIEGKITGTKWVSGKVLFTNMDYLIEGTLVLSNPDLYIAILNSLTGESTRSVVASPRTRTSLLCQTSS